MGKYGTANIGMAIKDYTDGEEISGYSRVTVVVSDEVSYTAGDDTGRTLTVENPWGTEAMAQHILRKVRNAPYKPYDASGAVVDAAMELGDTVSICGNTSRAYALRTNFGGLLKANVSAPGVEEMDEETPYKSATERKIIRQGKQLRTEFCITAGEIRSAVSDLDSRVFDGEDSLKAQLTTQITQTAASITSLAEQVLGDGEDSLKSTMRSQFQQTAANISAKVSKKSPDGVTSFAWDMSDTYWRLDSNGGSVLYADENGLQVKGTIRATAGTIGGFDVMKNYLSYNGQTWDTPKSRGAYIGQDGMSFGKNFSVTPEGALHAKTGEFDGAVRAGSITYGDNNGGYFNGEGISGTSISGGKMVYNTLGTNQFVNTVNTRLGYANYANDALVNGVEDVNIGDGRLWYQGHRITFQSVTVDGKTLKFLTWVN